MPKRYQNRRNWMLVDLLLEQFTFTTRHAVPYKHSSSFMAAVVVAAASGKYETTNDSSPRNWVHLFVAQHETWALTCPFPRGPTRRQNK